jgi:2-methylcitrate dehydratase
MTDMGQNKPFQFQRPYEEYVMSNVLFKISYPAEFHAQTAVECAHIIHGRLEEMGKTAEDIKLVKIRTQEAAMRFVFDYFRLPDGSLFYSIINKKGPLDNFADRE